MMDWRTIKYLIHLSLCFSLVNTQQDPTKTTTTDPPPSSNPSPSTLPSTSSSSTSSPSPNSTSRPPQEIDAATIQRFNLNVGAANVDYGPFAYHRKYIPTSSNHRFSYDPNHPRGPSRWAEQWPLCGGPLQSPIDISVEQCEQAEVQEFELQYYNSERQPSNVTVENNGYSVEMLFHFDDTPVLFGGPLTDGYIFEFIHFHWALQDGLGTEHQLSGVKYDLEMHLGHRNSKYPNLGEAGMHQDGILVLAFLFQVSDGASDWPQLMEVDMVSGVNSSVLVTDPERFVLSNFVGDLMEQIVNVRGSLTTPPCSPANWFLAPQIREVSRNDMEKFRRARRNGDPIAPNYRPLQPGQNRECTSYGGLL